MNDIIYKIIVLMQLPLVILISLLSFQSYKTLGIKEFKLISIAFLLNGFRLFIIGLDNQKIHVPFFEYLKVFFDVSNTCFFLLACKGLYEKWIRNKYLLNFIIISITIAAGVLMIYGAQKNVNIYFLNLPIKVLSIPGSLLSIVVLCSLAYFLKKTCEKFEIRSSITNLLFWGSFIYGIIQPYSTIATELLPEERALIIHIIAYAIALMSKIFILFGLYQLYMIAAGKVFKLDLILDRTFHEITTPLISINNNLNILFTASPSEMRISSKAMDVIQKVDNAYNRLIAIISASLKVYRSPTTGKDLAKLYEGMFDIPQDDKIESLSVNTLIEIAILDIKALNKKIDFECEYSGKCNVKCNSTELIQVFTNLFKNSSEAFNNTEGKIHIRTKNKIAVDPDTQDKLKTVNVEIEDNGSGIDPKIINKIYEEGFSTKNRGSGHGMAIVKEIVEKNGGYISDPESPPELPLIKDNKSGTKFVLIFPRDETKMESEKKMEIEFNK